MNRQERRKLARQQEVKAEYFRELQAHQAEVTEDVAMLHMMAYALALHEIGFGDKIIENTITTANRILSSLDGDKVTFWTLADELKAKTGIEIEWRVS